MEIDMRKIVLAMFLSLDGVMEEPSWTVPYWNDEIAKFKSDEISGSDSLLLGRVTYQGFAEAWPTSKDEGADSMNGIRKYVVSTTLVKADWNNSAIIHDNVFDSIKRLKEQPGRDILMYGSGILARTLLEHHLIDQLNLLVYPLVLGSGKRLFASADGQTKLKLIEHKSFTSGVVALIYQPEV
jgi:dihydrofolate reductase